MDIRNELVDEVKRYFVGPYEEGEALNDFPEETYISGLLFPKQSQQEPEDMDESQAGRSSDEDAGNSEENMHSRAWLLQNSIGIKCNLMPDVESLEIEVEYAKYVRGINTWQRTPIDIKKFTINLNDEKNHIEISDSHDEPESKITWDVDVDRNLPPRYMVLSVFLSNEMNQPDELDESGNKRLFDEIKTSKNQRIIFQPSIKIQSVDDKKIFLGTEVESEKFLIAPEEESLDLLFRNKQVFAQGYNCSASWDVKNKIPLFVKTEIIPVYDSKKIQFFSKTDKERPDEIDMVKLDSADNPKKVRDILEPIVLKYETWIGHVLEQANAIEGDDSTRKNTAKENHQKCLDALKRISDGLELLEDGTKPEIFESFKIANRAMLYQMARYAFAIGKSKRNKSLGSSPDVFKEGKYFWRPFQIAFLLMNLRGLSDTQTDDGKKQRETVDLLWFPTGGGKTEAYLALAAYSMVLRRIRGIGTEDEGLGISVMMRYTLRLLTLQQFERASTLICALEIMRRKEPDKLGSEPFLIGLWVGYGLTPNTWQNSKKTVEKLSRGEKADSGSPAQLNFCPWCGTDIQCNRNQNDYSVDDRRTKWTLVHCPNTGCDFYHRDRNDVQRALPVVTVDDDIYTRCPSLLIATVDKFARLPWNPKTASLFGIVNRKCPRCGFLNHSSKHNEAYHTGSGREIVENIERLHGPDLIIQDELHLITGPLGTMVGLYETAVEYLCSLSANGVGPKIVVSTATIRGVEDQVKKLYNRKILETFPPPAINYGDSFFWWDSEDLGRRYVGISYSHRSMKFALGRLYSSLLQRVHEIRGTIEDSKVDPYWTLVAYFNSTRELGGAIRLVEDDVKSNIRKMVSLIDFHSSSTERPLRGPEELTGRRTGDEIKELRRQLDQDMDSRSSIDILLATNMISVGIDVNRLGLMVVDGQTKNISEYIQATGRIGRRDDVPGLIFTLYNPYKPRDLSHYENFMGTHATLQKSVEPAGLTPFSDKAMERALHAVFLSLVRLVVENLSQNRDADTFVRGDPRVARLLKAIVDRYVSVQNLSESSPDYQLAKTILNQFQDNWEQFLSKSHSEHESVFYLDDSKYIQYDTVPKKEKILITDFAEKESGRKEKGFPKETPGSLRDVETEANLFYI